MTGHITVDGALISTDVDRLIRIISEKKRIELNELERQCGMERRAVDKWLRVLEDEGYISIVYGFSGTQVLWLGEGEYKHTTDKDVSAAISEMDTSRNSHESYDEVFSELAKEAKPDEPEKRLQDYIKRNREPEEVYEVEEDSIKDNILGKLRGRLEQKVQAAAEKKEERNRNAQPEPVAPPRVEEIKPEPAEEKPEPAETAVQVSDGKKDDYRRREFESPSTEMVEPHSDDDTQDAGHGTLDTDDAVRDEVVKPARMTGESAKVKDLVNAYLNEINKERAQLEKLENEKARIYRERYLALESKVEADIASITERILEKEHRVLALKERVLELPDKVGEVEKVHNAIAKLETDGREVLARTRTEVEGFSETIDAARADIERRMEDSRAKVDAEKERVTKLQELSDDVEHRVVDIRKSLDETEERINELNGTMKDLLSELEEATEMKVEISDMIDKVGISVNSKESELDKLESQMSEIRKVEKWVRDYVSDYESKIEEITNYVRASEDELSSLQESAESAYIKKYLRELDTMTSSYDSELNRASEDEKDVETKIAESRRRLNSLVRDSKEMIAKLRSDTANLPDFEPMRKSASDKAATVMQVIAEKEGERERLSEDFEKARGGKPMPPPEGPSPVYSGRLAAYAASAKKARSAVRRAKSRTKAKGKRRK